MPNWFPTDQTTNRSHDLAKLFRLGCFYDVASSDRLQTNVKTKDLGFESTADVRHNLQGVVAARL